jgi:hypothetical protein
MTRIYQKMSDEKMARVREWFKARLILGTHKKLAAELGVSEGRIQQITCRMRQELIEEINAEKRRPKQMSFPMQQGTYADS